MTVTKVSPEIGVDVAALGAKSDERTGTGGSCANGSNIFTASGFTSDDVGKVVTVFKHRSGTAAAIGASSGVATISDGTFTSRDVGRLVAIFGASQYDGPVPANLYEGLITAASGTSVTCSATLAANTVSGAKWFSDWMWQGHVVSVGSGTVTLDTNAPETDSGLPFWVNTDSSAVFDAAVATANAAATSVLAARTGIVYVRAGTYCLADVFMLDNVTILCDPGVTFRLAPSRLGASPAIGFHFGTLDQTVAARIQNPALICLGGQMAFDYSNIASRNSCAIQLGNVEHFRIEGVKGIGLPPWAGNVITSYMNTAGYDPLDGDVERLSNVQVRGTGSTGYQMNTGKDLRVNGITVDGGRALALEMDGGTSNVLDGITARSLKASDDGGLGAAMAWTIGPHATGLLRNVKIAGFRATGGAHGGASKSAAANPIENVEISNGRITGGGLAHFWNGSDNLADGITFRDVIVHDALGMGFQYIAESYYECESVNASLGGFKSRVTSRTDAPLVSRFFGCKARNNLVGGWLPQNTLEQLELYGCVAADDFYNATVVTNLLSTEDSEFEGGTTGTWAPNDVAYTIANSATAAHSGTKSMKLTNVSGGGVGMFIANQANATTAPAATAGLSYRGEAWVQGPTTGSVRITVWWYTSGNAFIAPAKSAAFVAVNPSGFTLVSGSLVAPPTAAKARLVLEVGSTTVNGDIYYFDDIKWGETQGVSNQPYGIVAAKGRALVYGGDFTRNAVGPYSISAAGSVLADQAFQSGYVVAPTAGTWKLGDRVYFKAPTSGGFIGAICVAAGSPGTWSTFGGIS